MFHRPLFSKKIFSAIHACLLVCALGAIPFFGVQAANLEDAFRVGDGGGDDPLDSAAQQAGYDINETSPNPIIQTIIQVALSFLGVIFLILTIYGGFLWMTAAGNEEQVTKARKILAAAVIGLIIVVAAYAISTLVISKLMGATLE